MAQSGRSETGVSGKKKPTATDRPVGESARRKDIAEQKSDLTAAETRKVLAEAREQQKATNEILQAIARSPADLCSVLQAVAENAARLCGADDVLIYRTDGNCLRQAVSLGPIPNTLDEGPVSRDWVTGRSVVDQRTIHIPDVASVSEEEYPISRAAQREHGHHTILATPLLTSVRPIGAIVIRRMEVKPFSNAQIMLLESFANQAVIAIENARLLNDLQDSLRQQTATAEVLKTISGTAFDLNAVLHTLLQSALELCSAFAGSFLIRKGDAFFDVVQIGWPKGFDEIVRNRPTKPGQNSVAQRVALTGEIVHVHDVLNDLDYEYKEAQELGGYRTVLGVPLVRDGEVIGILMLARDEVRPFADSEIRLIETFCDQAVIAFQNSRLFRELQDKNSGLSEALDQQTATAEILRVISTSPTDTQPVFDAIARHAATLCKARFCFVFRFDGDLLHFVADHGIDEKATKILHRAFPAPPGMDSAAQRSVMKRSVVQIADAPSDPDYRRTDLSEHVQYRSVIGVPMMRGAQAIGTIAVARSDSGEFPERQIELLQTFAEQAVIAIENVRLFTELERKNRELQETLDQQTATAEILRVISTSPTDTQPIFDAIARHGARLCRGQFCNVFRFDGELVHFVAHHGSDREAEEIIRRAFPDAPGMGSAAQRSILKQAVVQIPDVAADPDYERNDIAEYTNINSVIGVPIMRGDQTIGTITVMRSETGAFSDRHVELLQTFAEQAVIAVENVRLFTELDARNRALADSLEQQKATSEILAVISSSPTDAQPVFDTIVRNAVSLCGCLFANVFRYDGDQLHYLASHNIQPGYRELMEEKFPMRPDMSQVAGRTILAGSVVHLDDAKADPDYDQSFPAAAGWRRMLGVPMIRDGSPIGALVLGWPEPGQVDESQVKLIQTFAEQAVIAIENVRMFRELQTRLMHETATRQILSTISQSRGDSGPVFDMILENATRLCDARLAFLSLVDDERTCLNLVGYRGDISPGFLEILVNEPLPLDPEVAVTSRAVIDREVVQIEDMRNSRLYREGQPHRLRSVDVEGIRTLLVVPLVSNDVGIGALCLWRREARPFDHDSIELVKTFAEQAVIAVENVKQFKALETRLERETATAAILEVISQSRADEKPVFDVILESASRLCDAPMALMMMCNDERTHLHFPAHRGSRAGFVEMISENPQPFDSRVSLTAQAILQMKPVQVPDLADSQLYHEGQEHRVAAVELEGIRTFLSVPLISRGQGIGAICLYRREVKPFDEDQIDLVKTFAEQAVIAIENVRLFNELNETLQQQTATADVLKTISRSAFDLQVVLDALTESAARLCGAEMAAIIRHKDEAFSWASAYGLPPEHEGYVKNVRLEKGRGSIVGRVLEEGQTVHVADILADPEFTYFEAQRRAGFRTMLGVPLLRESTTIGVLLLMCRNVRPFSDAQIDLVTTFADQAVIAIENVRLFEEVQARTADLQESLQQQTATADVLKTISRSAFDLQTVLQALAESAVRLCNADHGTIARKKDGIFYRAVNHGLSPEFAKIVRDQPVEVQRGNAVGRALLNGEIVHIPDVERDPEYTFLEARTLGGLRTILAVPMLREGEAIGVFALTRTRVEPFTDEQIELVSTFADQAAIAIENVRLFESAEARSRELANSLSELRNAQDRLVQTEKLASLGQLTAGIAHEIKNPLNFVNNFASVSVELIDEMTEELKKISLDSEASAAIGEVAEMLTGNLSKIAEHGKRADSIVKNMLMHARQGSNDHRPVDINALVEESLNLAYHGARAEKQGFTIDLERELDEAAGEADVFPQEITRVLLNLISNGFYSASRRGEETGVEPKLTVKTRDCGDTIEISVRDNGYGIDAETKKKLFSPFFTTKPVGEGTGLGLSISHDIIVKQHGGTIDVESAPGEYCEFRIGIPRDAAARMAGASP